MQETSVQSLGWEDPLEEGKATHSSILAWRSSNGKESACHAGDQGSIPGLESSQWQSTPVFLPGEFHGQGNLVGHSLWGHKESDTTE